MIWPVIEYGYTKKEEEEKVVFEINLYLRKKERKNLCEKERRETRGIYTLLAPLWLFIGE